MLKLAMQSIHGKITLVFTTLAGLMVALGLFAFIDLLYLEGRVQQGVVVADLEYTLLAMRLQEKNLFLYADRTAGDEAAASATRAIELLQKENNLFTMLNTPTVSQQLQHALGEYLRLLRKFTELPDPEQNMEKAIRAEGHTISQIAEGLVVRERRALADSIATSQWALSASILLLVVVMFALGRLLDRRVVTPLRRLPKQLRPIAEGRFQHLISRSDEAEIVAFTNAFNTMLDELESRRRRLVQSEKLAALGVLVAGVAHELNNPLSNVSSSCQLLLEELDTAEREQLREWASTIDGETERARRIVAALMDYGRRREAQFVTVPLAELLRTTLLLLKGPLRKSGGRIELEIPEALLLHADPQRLQQVFINLLRNAVESGEGVTVRVRATPCGSLLPTLPAAAEVVGEPNCPSQDNRQTTQIVIEDNGRGIPGEDLAHVFEPFYSRREEGHGMGLGLYIVQEIIQEHEGCIGISSQPQQGTTLYLRLPCSGGEA